MDAVRRGSAALANSGAATASHAARTVPVARPTALTEGSSAAPPTHCALLPSAGSRAVTSLGRPVTSRPVRRQLTRGAAVLQL